MQFRYVFIMAIVLLGSCSPPAQLGVDNVTINVSPIENRPGSGYFTLTGGNEDVYLQAITSDYIQRIEMHESIDKNGMSGMREIENVLVPSGGKVVFAPGGKHLMVWGIRPAMVERGTVDLKFVFSDGTRYLIPAKIQIIGGGGISGAMANTGTQINDVDGERQNRK